MTTKVAVIAVAVAISALASTPSEALADNVAPGEALFKQRCAVCHTLDEGVNRLGPSLHGVFGREVGTAAGFRYSRGLAEAGFAWDEEKLDAWLAGPSAMIAGNRMAFPGLRDVDQRADLIRFLKRTTKN